MKILVFLTNVCIFKPAVIGVTDLCHFVVWKSKLLGITGLNDSQVVRLVGVNKPKSSESSSPLCLTYNASITQFFISVYGKYLNFKIRRPCFDCPGYLNQNSQFIQHP